MPRITENVGDIFSAPPNSVLIHACNCKGAWGGGVALEFKKRFPKAFDAYYEECNTPPSPFHQRSLLGTALVIPPLDDEEDGYWIACLFTSLAYGKSKSPADVILEMTRKAMGDLDKKLKFLRGTGQDLGDLWMVRINSGKFGVPWPRTKRILEQFGMDLTIVYPAEEDEETKTSGKKDAGSPPSTKQEELSTLIPLPAASGPSARASEPKAGQPVEALIETKDKSKKRKRNKPEVHDGEKSQRKKKEKAVKKSKNSSNSP